MNLNLGSGTDYRPGWVNVDLYGDRVDERVDLFRYPWPWPSDCAGEVLLSHHLEHQPDPLRCLAECWRVLAPGGLLTVRVPHVRGLGACAPTHERFFSRNTFRQYTVEAGRWIWMAYNAAARFAEVSYRVRFGYGGALGRALLWRWLEPIASRWPRAWEKFSPVQPDEITWRATAIK